MQPPDQPAPGEPNPVPPQVPPTGSTQPSEPTASTPPPSPESIGGPSKEEKTWAMASHLSSLIGYLIAPGGNVVAPLIIWLIKKDTMPFVEDQAKESLNFQITLTGAAIIGIALVWACIGGVIIAAAWVVGLIFTIVASVKANEGVKYRYPITIRFVK